MELSFNQLKKLQVISLDDGKNLGHICDIIFICPENQIKGYSVTGGKGFRLTRDEQFIAVSQVVKIGEDVMLVKGVLSGKDCRQEGACPPEQGRHPKRGGRRDFGDYE